jgi:hypothetical protein
MKHNAMKTYGGLAVQLHPRRNSCRYPLHRRMGGLRSRSGRSGEEKNFLPLPGIEPRCPSRSLSLYRLSYPYSTVTVNVLSKFLQIAPEFHGRFTVLSSNCCLTQMCKSNVYVTNSFLKTVIIFVRTFPVNQ